MARVYRVTFKSHYPDGTLVEPGLHYQTDLGIGEDEPDPSDVMGEIWAHLGTAYRNILPAAVTTDELVGVEQVLPPAIGEVGRHGVSQVGTGFGAESGLPKALVPLISLHTETASRSARGHLFGCGPGVLSTLETGGIWSSSTQGFLNAFAALLDDQLEIGAVNVSQINPVIYSRTRHIRGQTPYTFRVTGATAKTHPTWLRSRLSNP